MRPACPQCPRGTGGSRRRRTGWTRSGRPSRAPRPSSGLLELRALHHDRVHALVVPEEGADVLRVDPQLPQVPLADLRFPVNPRVARSRDSSCCPAIVMFFATSSRNFSWITQKLHTAMSWTELLYSSATARS